MEHETLSGVALDAVLSTVEPIAIEDVENGNGRRPRREDPRAPGT